ncbi:sugar transferase [Bdellovibrio sp. HCB-162]|uniref:sugar transferase n=1 Tax=Bdellovibrio sp. HCB-162 TaxID=3394234 RepID=UPI0039BD100A
MWLGKRIFDFALAIVGLVVLSPLFVLIAIWIKLDSPGPIFFRQTRVGLRGSTFRIHKFRTMRTDAEKNGPQLTVGRDVRVTHSGELLRKYKIDELPQLIDVLIGNMSFVGPRPEVPRYVAKYPAEIREKALSVRPGITDRASIEFKDENVILGTSSDPERDYVEKILPIKLKYHLEYIARASLLEDLKLIFLTLKEIFISR